MTIYLKKQNAWSIFMLSAMMLTACINDERGPDNQPCLRGEGSVISETRDVDEFSRITLAIPGELYIIQGSTSEVVIEAKENIVLEIETRVKNGDLEISFVRDNTCTRDTGPIDVHVTMVNIEEINIAGAANVTGENIITDELAVSIAGAGNFNLSGETEILEIDITGAGNVSAFDLSSLECGVTITGSGNAEITVENELEVSITGSGNVFYKGNPQVNTSITGSGNVLKAD